jgi:hypothetical protein
LRLDKAQLLSNLDKIHTTELGKKRITENMCLTSGDVVTWCIQKIQDTRSVVSRKGKNWYITANNCVITVNAHSYTIITAHQERKKRFPVRKKEWRGKNELETELEPIPK